MYELKCPKGTGDIYGNLLRQIALRGIATWRIAGFHIGEKSELVGFSGSVYFDSLTLWSSKLEILNPPSETEFCIETFKEVGTAYESQHFRITNLPSGLSSFEVALVKASGSRSVEENATLIAQYTKNASSFVSISSRHSDVIVVAFEVEHTGDGDIVTFLKGGEDAAAALQRLKETLLSFSFEE